MDFVLEIFNPIQRRALGRISVLRQYAEQIDFIGTKKQPRIRLSTNDYDNFKLIQRIIKNRNKYTGVTFTVIKDSSKNA